MPTTYMDQFWIIDPYSPPPVGTALTVSYFSIVDQNSNGQINRFSNDSIDGSDIRASYPGDTVTVTLASGSTVTITGATFYLADGRQVFTPIDGSNLPNGTLVSTTWVSGQQSVTPPQLGTPCFTPGTMIRTERGERRVEDLRAGDLVATADRGLAPVLMLHRRGLSEAHLIDKPQHGPVLFKAGALGQGLPRRDLLVSPQHRMMIRSPVAARMFASAEILVPACQLAGQPGIARAKPDGGIDYIHVLLDHHAVIYAEGAPTETLFLGEQVHEQLSQRDVDRIRSVLPYGPDFSMQPARPLVRGGRLKRLLQRHYDNAKPLLDVPSKATAQAPGLRLVSNR
jgi:Hint domain